MNRPAVGMWELPFTETRRWLPLFTSVTVTLATELNIQSVHQPRVTIQSWLCSI